MNFNQLGERVGLARFELDCATRIRDQAIGDLEKVGTRLADIKEAQVLAQGAAQEVQDHTYGCIAGIVTQCLEAVFEEPYEFRLDFVKKRGKTEAVLSFERDGRALDPLTESGGGVVDVAAFALRLASLILLGGKVRRLLVLDEPFKFLSAEYRDRVRELLSLLAQKLDLQIVMVTHIRELEVGKVVALA